MNPPQTELPFVATTRRVSEPPGSPPERRPGGTEALSQPAPDPGALTRAGGNQTVRLLATGWGTPSQML
jgi:hypothetical protein